MENETTQLSFLNDNSKAKEEPVECLGMTFKNDDERREYFREELRKKLPELKKIEGFPTTEDESIIEISDPPYYTACPNPWLDTYINTWKKKYFKEKVESGYNRAPYTNDVIETKFTKVYKAHSYHTKVPPEAIAKYLRHYTNDGDVILDGFSGSGMTGYATKTCNDEGGRRLSILNDLSPAATLMSYNYNVSLNKEELEKSAMSIIKKLRKDFDYYHTTFHSLDGNTDEKGHVNYVVWSDVFICNACQKEIIFWDQAVDKENKKVMSDFECGHCKASTKKKELANAKLTYYDNLLNETITIIKQVPVLINYTYNKKRFEKKPDSYDLDLINEIKIKSKNINYKTQRMPEGRESRRNDRKGLTHTHLYYTERNLVILSKFLDYARKSKYFAQHLFYFQAATNLLAKTSRYRFGTTGNLSGTLYVPSLIVEKNAIDYLETKLKDYLEIINDEKRNDNVIVSTQSFTGDLKLSENSIDYIFTDPPFGENLMYSELNYLWESWLEISTSAEKEAIVNKAMQKTILDYKKLMEHSFKNYYTYLKPGHWMTVEFSNSQASVWNAIQEAIQKAGFIIANVSALDKKQGSFKAVTTTTAVKQDLVISSYKPKEVNVVKIRNSRFTPDSAWTFVIQHLHQLPVFLGNKGEAEAIPERTPRILFDRMVAYFVQNGFEIPVSSGEFQLGISQRFPMRDGMVFLDSQVAEYDKKRTMVKDFSQLNLFVSDENSAIEWLRQQLLKKPQTRQEVHPQFMKELQHIAKHEILPELDDLLNQNFLRYDGEDEVPSQILTHLRRNYKDLRGLEGTNPRVIEKARYRWFVPNPNKQADLERLREKSLLREYENYLKEIEGNKKKLKVFRTEAIRAGFKKAYSEKDFESIVQVGDCIPEKVLQEDDKLLMYYDNALIRMGL